jgi:hypothetical protein
VHTATHTRKADYGVGSAAPWCSGQLPERVCTAQRHGFRRVFGRCTWAGVLTRGTPPPRACALWPGRWRPTAHLHRRRTQHVVLSGQTLPDSPSASRVVRRARTMPTCEQARKSRVSEEDGEEDAGGGEAAQPVQPAARVNAAAVLVVHGRGRARPEVRVCTHARVAPKPSIMLSSVFASTQRQPSLAFWTHPAARGGSGRPSRAARQPKSGKRGPADSSASPCVPTNVRFKPDRSRCRLRRNGGGQGSHLRVAHLW